MRQRLMRPTAALFPIVGLVGALAGGGTHDFILIVFLLYYVVQLVSLCAADSFRNAAACEPGVRRVDRRFGGALLPLAIGIAAVFAATMLLRPATHDGADHAALLFNQTLCATTTAGLILIEHLFEERMFALGRRIDGVALSCVSNGLLLAGLLLDAGSGGNTCFLGAAALGAGISVVANYLIEPAHGFSLAPRNLRFAPKACLQTLLYPAIAIAASLFLSNGDGAKLDATLPTLLFGLIPWRLARTTARRTEDESLPLNLLLISIAALTAAVATWFPALLPCAVAAALALFCGAAIYCAPTWRLWTGVALTIAALLPFPTPFLNMAFSLAAIILNLKNAFRRKV